MPAFPVLEAKQLGGNMVLDLVAPGVSKLEFIACNAPSEIPSWFKHTPPAVVVTERPSIHKLTAEDKKAVEQWHEFDCELPERLKWYDVQLIKHIDEQAAFDKLDKAAHYFQWRRYYAEQLLLELSKPQP